MANDAEALIPDASDPAKKHRPTMLTTGLSLRFYPAHEKVSRRFLADFDAFSDAYARPWSKLTHRDMGPKARYLGPEVPAEDLAWQDPLPKATGTAIDAADIAALKATILDSGASVPDLVFTAWASASTFRAGDIAAALTARACASHRSRTGRRTTRRGWRRCSPRSKACRPASTAAPAASTCRWRT